MSLVGMSVGTTDSLSAKTRQHAEYYRGIVDGTITDVYDTDSTSIKSNLFSFCYELRSASFTNVIKTGNQVFYLCRNLTNINFPKAIQIGSYFCSDCSSLVSVNLPLVNKISAYGFQRCTSLTTATFPLCGAIPNDMFNGCTELISASFPVASNVYERSFYGCSKLSVLRLDRVSSVPTLSATNPFTGTPETMKIVVPDALVDSFKTATNWSTYADRIIGVTEYDAMTTS